VDVHRARAQVTPIMDPKAHRRAHLGILRRGPGVYGVATRDALKLSRVARSLSRSRRSAARAAGWIFVACLFVSCDLQQISSTMSIRSLATHELQVAKADAAALVDGVLREADIESRIVDGKVFVRWGTDLMHVTVKGNGAKAQSKVEVIHEGPTWLAQDLFIRLDLAAGAPCRIAGGIDESCHWRSNQQEVDLWLRRKHGDPAPICDPWRNDALLRFPSDADGAALSQVVESGADLTRPMIVTFAFRFSGDDAAHRLAHAVTMIGFTSAVEARDDAWMCSASKQMFVSYRLIEAAREELAGLAAPDAGEFVGWSTDGLPR
jgi:hypothetical protein